MYYEICENFTDNEMTIKGTNAINFYRNFQHVLHYPNEFIIKNMKEIIYNFSYSGKPNHDYLIICKKDFPDVNFEIKGYYYPQELQDGLSEIFLITNKGMYIKDARAIGLDEESDETAYENFFAIAKEDISRNCFNFN